MAHGMLITEALVLINPKGLRVMFEDMDVSFQLPSVTKHAIQSDISLFVL